MGTSAQGAGGLDDLALLRSDSSALTAAARRGPLDAPVAGCPGWDLARLCGHLGRVHRWVTLVVEARENVPADRVAPTPEDPALAVDYFAEGAVALLGTLAATDPGAPCWNWWAVHEVAGFWRRRMSVETALHRWDAESAVGSPSPLDSALAAAGVDELLDVFLPTTVARTDGGVVFGGSLHLHATDHDGEWTITGDGTGSVGVERGHAKGDAAVRGSASDLLLLLWRRIPHDHPDLTMFGDAAVVDAWLKAGVP